MNILKGKDKKDLLKFIDTHKIVPEDFDVNNKVLIFVYHYIRVVLLSKLGTSVNYFIDESYYKDDLNSEIYIATLPALKRTCENWYKINSGRFYGVPLLKRKIYWEVLHYIRNYKRPNQKPKYGTHRYQHTYVSFDDQFDIYDENITSPELALEYSKYKEKELLLAEKAKSQSEKSKYEVFIHGNDVTMFFDSTKDVASFFSLNVNSIYRSIDTSPTYLKYHNKRSRSVSMIRKVVKL
jgi:hypothetical protein